MVGRAAQREARSRAIQAAARRLFLARGVDVTTMEQVAEEAGVSRATLFNYYPGKPALLEAISASLEQRLVDALSHYLSKQESAPAALAELYAHAARVLEQTADLTRLLLLGKAGPGGFPALRRAFVELAVAGQAQGAWRSDVGATRVGEVLYLDFIASLLGWCEGGADDLASRCADLNRLLKAWPSG
ncbi:MAG: helix-turn-helix domain-containing protein [Halieaceae bacterium]|nr:helix-turn-helix domain-containing protein [Halieaceae bacterium]